MKKIIRTKALNSYLIKFAAKIIIFLAFLVIHFSDRTFIESFLNQPFIITPFFDFITPMHILWLIFMLTMIHHIIPSKRISMAWKKSRKEKYRPAEKYSELDLLKFVQIQNLSAWKVMLLWLCFNAIFGILYLSGIMNSGDMVMLSVFYYLCDYICILIFCPFQTFIMKNKCCINCRIYDWGHFMMFTPMLFIKSFYSWSLFFTSLIVLLHWEIVYAKYPERFYENTNLNLKCENCIEKTCQIKRTITKKQ